MILHEEAYNYISDDIPLFDTDEDDDYDENDNQQTGYSTNDDTHF